VACEEVTVKTVLGPAPAWLVPYGDATGPWVIQVHGRGADRRECIRAVPVFHQAGHTSLLISYRNDGVAPSSADGRYALGDTEWVDVESAIRFAVDRGATRITLMGWSMGGALVLQCITRSSLSGMVGGIVLESPVIDWIRVLDHHAGALRIPGVIRRSVYRLIGASWGRRFTGQAEAIDLPRLDFVSRAAELRLPTLLLHSESDTFVPSAGSRALARLRPDIVTHVSFSGAGHTRLWNYEPERWNRAIMAWLHDTSAVSTPGVRRPSSP
jgi:alpha-beta hydrolase superfamily lysophospholipase